MSGVATSTPFGDYVRGARQRAGLSLRELGKALGVSHVYVREVECGHRPPFVRERWPALMAALPGITKSGLVYHLALTEGVTLSLADASPAYRELAIALADPRAREIRDDDALAILNVLRGRQ